MGKQRRERQKGPKQDPKVGSVAERNALDLLSWLKQSSLDSSPSSTKGTKKCWNDRSTTPKKKTSKSGKVEEEEGKISNGATSVLPFTQDNYDDNLPPQVNSIQLSSVDFDRFTTPVHSSPFHPSLPRKRANGTNDKKIKEAHKKRRKLKDDTIRRLTSSLEALSIQIPTSLTKVQRKNSKSKSHDKGSKVSSKRTLTNTRFGLPGNDILSTTPLLSPQKNKNNNKKRWSGSGPPPPSALLVIPSISTTTKTASATPPPHPPPLITKVKQSPEESVKKSSTCSTRNKLKKSAKKQLNSSSSSLPHNVKVKEAKAKDCHRSPPKETRLVLKGQLPLTEKRNKNSTEKKPNSSPFTTPLKGKEDETPPPKFKLQAKEEPLSRLKRRQDPHSVPNHQEVTIPKGQSTTYTSIMRKGELKLNSSSQYYSSPVLANRHLVGANVKEKKGHHQPLLKECRVIIKDLNSAPCSYTAATPTAPLAHIQFSDDDEDDDIMVIPLLMEGDKPQTTTVATDDEIYEALIEFQLREYLESPKVTPPTTLPFPDLYSDDDEDEEDGKFLKESVLRYLTSTEINPTPNTAVEEEEEEGEEDWEDFEESGWESRSLKLYEADYSPNDDEEVIESSYATDDDVEESDHIKFNDADEYPLDQDEDIFSECYWNLLVDLSKKGKQGKDSNLFSPPLLKDPHTLSQEVKGHSLNGEQNERVPYEIHPIVLPLNTNEESVPNEEQEEEELPLRVKRTELGDDVDHSPVPFLSPFHSEEGEDADASVLIKPMIQDEDEEIDVTTEDETTTPLSSPGPITGNGSMAEEDLVSEKGDCVQNRFVETLPSPSSFSSPAVEELPVIQSGPAEEGKESSKEEYSNPPSSVKDLIPSSSDCESSNPVSPSYTPEEEATTTEVTCGGTSSLVGEATVAAVGDMDEDTTAVTPPSSSESIVGTFVTLCKDSSSSIAEEDMKTKADVKMEEVPECSPAAPANCHDDLAKSCDDLMESILTRITRQRTRREEASSLALQKHIFHKCRYFISY